MKIAYFVINQAECNSCTNMPSSSIMNKMLITANIALNIWILDFFK